MQVSEGMLTTLPIPSLTPLFPRLRHPHPYPYLPPFSIPQSTSSSPQETTILLPRLPASPTTALRQPTLPCRPAVNLQTRAGRARPTVTRTTQTLYRPDDRLSRKVVWIRCRCYCCLKRPMRVTLALERCPKSHPSSLFRREVPRFRDLMFSER